MVAILGYLPNLNFCHLGIFQVVLCFEMAVGGGAGVVGFFAWVLTFAVGGTFLMS